MITVNKEVFDVLNSLYTTATRHLIIAVNGNRLLLSDERCVLAIPCLGEINGWHEANIYEKYRSFGRLKNLREMRIEVKDGQMKITVSTPAEKTITSPLVNMLRPAIMRLAEQKDDGKHAIFFAKTMAKYLPIIKKLDENAYLVQSGQNVFSVMSRQIAGFVLGGEGSEEVTEAAQKSLRELCG